MALIQPWSTLNTSISKFVAHSSTNVYHLMSSAQTPHLSISEAHTSSRTLLFSSMTLHIQLQLIVCQVLYPA